MIQKIGGWKTRSVFERYAIVSQTDITDAVLKLEASERIAQKAEENENSYNLATVKQKQTHVEKPQPIN